MYIDFPLWPEYLVVLTYQLKFIKRRPGRRAWEDIKGWQRALSDRAKLFKMGGISKCRFMFGNKHIFRFMIKSLGEQEGEMLGLILMTSFWNKLIHWYIYAIVLLLSLTGGQTVLEASLGVIKELVLIERKLAVLPPSSLSSMIQR